MIRLRPFRALSGIVGAAAATANADYSATGVRIRDLPVTFDKVPGGLPATGLGGFPATG